MLYTSTVALEMGAVQPSLLEVNSFSSLEFGGFKLDSSIGITSPSWLKNVMLDRHTKLGCPLLLSILILTLVG